MSATLPVLQSSYAAAVATFAALTARRDAAPDDDAREAANGEIETLAAELHERLADLHAELELALDVIPGGTETSALRFDDEEIAGFDDLARRVLVWQRAIGKARDALWLIGENGCDAEGPATALERLRAIRERP